MCHQASLLASEREGSRGVRRTSFPHHEVVATVVLYGQEDLRDHNQDAALRGWIDGPGTFCVGWVVAWVVGGLDIASELTQLPTTLAICSQAQWTKQERKGKSVGKQVGEIEEF